MSDIKINLITKSIEVLENKYKQNKSVLGLACFQLLFLADITMKEQSLWNSTGIVLIRAL